MEIARSNLQISYDNEIGLPFDINALSTEINQAFDYLKSALACYAKSLINGVPSGQEININIKLTAIPGVPIYVTMLGLENEIHFLLIDGNGHPYIAITDKCKKGEIWQ